MKMRDLGRLAVPEKFWVRNFKSLKNFELDLPSKLTIIVGANGSGKTSIVEIFELLNYILEWARRRIINPFHKWWGYGNAVWKHDEDLPITIGFKIRLENLQEKMSKILDPEIADYLLGFIIPERFKRNSITAEIVYEFDVTGKGGKFQIQREKITITDRYMEVNVDTSKRQISVTINMRDLLEAFHHFNTALLQNLKERQGEDLEFLLDEHSYLSRIRREYMKFIDVMDSLGIHYEEARERFIDLALSIPGIVSVELYKLDFTHQMENDYSVFYVFPEVERRLELGISNFLDIAIDILEDSVNTDKLEKSLKNTLEKAIQKGIHVNSASNKYSELAETWSGANLELLNELIMRILHKLLTKYILDEIVDSIILTSAIIYGFMDGVAVVKSINWEKVVTPQPLEKHSRLYPDASNFIQFFFTLTGGSVSQGVREALKYCFPGPREFNIRFEVTDDGRVYLNLIADDMTLKPVSIPCGVLKTLLLEALLEWKPTLLVVDEFENSLHPEVQQFLIDEFRSSGVHVVLTTHSTIPLNYAKGVEEVVVLVLENGESKPRRLREDVLKLLETKRLTLSELLLSGLAEFQE
jgi:predicted ATPase